MTQDSSVAGAAAVRCTGDDLFQPRQRSHPAGRDASDFKDAYRGYGRAECARPIPGYLTCHPARGMTQGAADSGVLNFADDPDIAQAGKPDVTYFCFVFASRRDASARAGERAGAESARIPSGCGSFPCVDPGWKAANNAAFHPGLIFWHPCGMPVSSLPQTAISTAAIEPHHWTKEPYYLQSKRHWAGKPAPRFRTGRAR